MAFAMSSRPATVREQGCSGIRYRAVDSRPITNRCFKPNFESDKP
jgi:hypothetical protein